MIGPTDEEIRMLCALADLCRKKPSKKNKLNHEAFIQEMRRKYPDLDDIPAGDLIQQVRRIFG